MQFEPNNVSISYGFVPPGTPAYPKPGIVYLDVGNGLGPGVLDHHQPDAPVSCACSLALRHREYVVSQIPKAGDPVVTLITHLWPDLDAVSAIWIARGHLTSLPPMEYIQRWVEYVQTVDRGETILQPERPVTPYSVFMMRIHLAEQVTKGLSPEKASAVILEMTLAFIDLVLSSLAMGRSLNDPGFFDGILEVQNEIEAIYQDHARYESDMARIELFRVTLPRQDETGLLEVPGLWIYEPTASLFKSWARGDRRRAGQAPGFVFTGVWVHERRAIISVTPDSGVHLRGLGTLLEIREDGKRRDLGQPREGPPRPGYGTPDPWYDGRSPGHAYTIVDSPAQGTVLSSKEVRETFNDYLEAVINARVV